MTALNTNEQQYRDALQALRDKITLYKKRSNTDNHILCENLCRQLKHFIENVEDLSQFPAYQKNTVISCVIKTNALLENPLSVKEMEEYIQLVKQAPGKSLHQGVLGCLAWAVVLTVITMIICSFVLAISLANPAFILLFPAAVMLAFALMPIDESTKAPLGINHTMNDIAQACAPVLYEQVNSPFFFSMVGKNKEDESQQQLFEELSLTLC